jgi:uncharacterized protein (DUF427 family)
MPDAVQPRQHAGQQPVPVTSGPPRVEACQRRIVAVFAGRVIADTTRARCVLEPGRAPVYYVPPGDYVRACFRPTADESFCEWKGVARDFDVVVGDQVARRAAWAYAAPPPRYACLADCIAVHPGRVDACYVDGERVRPQDDPFHGGWITRDVAGFRSAGTGTRR